jgi:hypothetical protein
MGFIPGTEGALNICKSMDVTYRINCMAVSLKQSQRLTQHNREPRNKPIRLQLTGLREWSQEHAVMQEQSFQ